MRSTVTKLYDYKQMEIPAEWGLWRITDGEIAEKLETLSRNHAYETEPETVGKLDSVACSGKSNVPRWSRKSLRFYPGRGLCDAAIENALLGARVGESRVVATDEGELTLTVTRVIRRRNMPIGDELVRTEGIDGVETVADYYSWYRKTNEPERRNNAAMGIAYRIIREITEKSEFFIDEEEKRAWLNDQVDCYYRLMLQAGIDPTVPKDGVEFLTEEQAKAEIYAEHEHLFVSYAANGYLVRTLAGVDDLDAFCQAEIKRMAEEKAVAVDVLTKDAGWAAYYDRVLMQKAFDLFLAYAEQFLED